MFAGLTVPIVEMFATGPGADAIAATVVITFAAFFVPTAALSATSPIVTRARVRELATAGHVIGGLSAASTAGALGGTFLAGFVLVGSVATSRALYGLAAALVALGVALTPSASAARRTLSTAAAVVIVGPLAVNAPSPCPIETDYYCVSVRTARDDPDGRVLELDRLIQGYSDLGDARRVGFRFQRVIAAAIDDLAGGRSLRALHLGGGAFALPRYVAATHPQSINRVLEIDPRLDDIAVGLLGLDPLRVDVRNGDGRILLEREPSGSYDFVINDVLGSLDPPWHLTTIEVAHTAKRLLAPGGAYVVNAVDTPSMRFAQAEAATLGMVFENVVIVVPPPARRESPANVVLIATDELIGPLRIDDEDGVVLDPSAAQEFIDGGIVLHDDFAPVERLVGEER